LQCRGEWLSNSSDYFVGVKSCFFFGGSEAAHLANSGKSLMVNWV